MKISNSEVVPIEQLIVVVRNHKVILDSSLAALYQVETKRIVEAIKRNKKRFPPDFVFQLTSQEFAGLKNRESLSKRHGGRRIPPYVFTEQGVAMASSVLNSERAISVNVDIMRAFVRMRELTKSKEEIDIRLNQIEEQLGSHSKQIRQIFLAIKAMLEEPALPARPIGLHRDK